MLGLAPRRKVQVRVVAQPSWSLYRIAYIILGQFLYGVVGSLVDQVTLLDPAFDSSCGANAGESFFPLQDLDSFAIFHPAPAVVPGGFLVAAAGLPRRHVIDLDHATASAIAGSDSQQ